MADTNNNTLMWIFTIILVIGFVLIHKNLNNETYFGSKYEGLYISLFGLICSVYIGVNSANQGVEKFVSLYGL